MKINKVLLEDYFNMIPLILYILLFLKNFIFDLNKEFF